MPTTRWPGRLPSWRELGSVGLLVLGFWAMAMASVLVHEYGHGAVCVASGAAIAGSGPHFRLDFSQLIPIIQGSFDCLGADAIGHWWRVAYLTAGGAATMAYITLWLVAALRRPWAQRSAQLASVAILLAYQALNVYAEFVPHAPIRGKVSDGYRVLAIAGPWVAWSVALVGAVALCVICIAAWRRWARLSTSSSPPALIEVSS